MRLKWCDESLAGKQYILGYTVRFDCGQERVLKAGERLGKNSEIEKGCLYNNMQDRLEWKITGVIQRIWRLQGGLEWKITGVIRCIWRLLTDIGT